MTPHAPQPPASSHVTNTAQTVAIQGQVIHNATVYMNVDLDPEQEFERGLQALEEGVPIHAEKKISNAIMRGYRNSRSRFYWVHAMFSKRSYRDLDRVERSRLDALAGELDGFPEDKYRNALEAFVELIALLHREHTDHDRESHDMVEKRILSMDAELLELTQRHLEFVLSGATKDKLWTDTRDRARKGRFSGDRAHRVWAYFHPEPVRARALEPDPIQPADWTPVVAGSAAAAVAAGYLFWTLLTNIEVAALLAFIAAGAAGYIGIPEAFEWRYRVERIRLEDERNSANAMSGHPRGKGFARKVSLSFDRYFGKYRPPGWEVDDWLAHTVGVRDRLRREITHIYREQSVPHERVKWLIGFLAQDVRDRWMNGTLFDHHQRFAVSARTRNRCLLGLTAMLACTGYAVAAAVPAEPFAIALTIVGLAFGGPYTAWRWHRNVAEQRRFDDDTTEYEARLARRTAAYRRWKGKLDSIRPTDREMETWLYYDKTVLIDEALRTYRLSWRDVIAHAVLPGPAAQTRAGRTSRSTWRYSRYDLRVFLITEDGVREVLAQLDFEHIVFPGQERNNYRFDALSSVYVVEHADNGRALSVTLTNGPARTINVTAAEIMRPPAVRSNSDVSELPEYFLEMNLSAAGFWHAQQILEGIAAEGKGWIDRNDFIRQAPDSPDSPNLRTMPGM
ncbi:MAG: hypothetical protein HOQ24_05925 [Mycobacteriaceae bacterium]|nr:hypothetical protein [Mycobacteriaceae bacterium]